MSALLAIVCLWLNKTRFSQSSAFALLAQFWNHEFSIKIFCDIKGMSKRLETTLPRTVLPFWDTLTKKTHSETKKNTNVDFTVVSSPTLHFRWEWPGSTRVYKSTTSLRIRSELVDNFVFELLTSFLPALALTRAYKYSRQHKNQHPWSSSVWLRLLRHKPILFCASYWLPLLKWSEWLT